MRGIERQKAESTDLFRFKSPRTEDAEDLNAFLEKEEQSNDDELFIKLNVTEFIESERRRKERGLVSSTTTSK